MNLSTPMPLTPREGEALSRALEKAQSEVVDIPIIIGGKEIRTSDTGSVVMPHNYRHKLATYKVGGKRVTPSHRYCLESKKGMGSSTVDGAHLSDASGSVKLISAKSIAMNWQPRNIARTK